MKTPFAWAAIGMRDGDGDPVGPWLYWTRHEAEYAATTYRNGIKRDRPGYVRGLYLDESDAPSGETK